MDAHAVAVHVARLEQMHKSALPSAVRGTLNGMAFETKKEHMPREAKRAFVQRNKNFFRATSKVQTAKGFDVDNMQSIIGFIGGSENQAVDDLEQQERGGVIKSRSFIPTTTARSGKAANKPVARRNRMSGINNIVRVSDAEGSSPQQKFIKSAVHAGKGGLLLTSKSLLRVKSIKRSGNSWKIKTEQIYEFKDGRNVKITTATNFMKKATLKAAKRGTVIFNKEAQRQIKRLK